MTGITRLTKESSPMRHLALSTVAAAALLLGACAATTPAPATSGATPASSSDPLAALRSFTISDLQAALADAQAHNDQTAAQCYAFLATNLPTLPSFSAAKPVGAILAFQRVRDLTNGV